MKITLLFTFLFLWISGNQLYAQTPIFSPSMSISCLNGCNSPAGEDVGNAIDGSTSTKFLDFNKNNTGFTVNTNTCPSIVTRMDFSTANDFPERDPRNYIIRGSNNGSSWTFITGGNLSCISARNNTRTINFSNTNAYSYYQIEFATVCDAAAANSMQLSEVQLYGEYVGVEVESNGTLIEDGQISTTKTNNTDFGTLCGLATKTNTYIVTNHNDAAISFSSVSSTNSDFSIVGAPTTLAAGASTSFDIVFTPSTNTGTTASSTITLNNNSACGGANYDFVIEGTDGGTCVEATGLDFDGSNDYVEINSVAPLMVGANNLSIEAWINADATQSGNDYILAVNTAGKGNRLLFYLGHGILKAFDGSSSFTFSTTDLRDNAWHHVAFTIEGTTLKGYLDGVFQGVATMSAPVFLANDLWSIGQEWDSGSSPTDLFKGKIDEVRIWDRILCPTEIAQHPTCQLVGNEANLVAYYPFDQGYELENNSTVTTLTDLTANNVDGTLINFVLDGTTSNWAEGNTTISGACTSIALVEPEVEVRGNGQLIVDGDITPDVADNTDFGSTFSGVGVQQSFSVASTNAIALNIYDITITGADAADFSVVTSPSSPTTNSTFTIEFNPLGVIVGTKTATITVITDDCDEELYTFTIEGELVGPPATGLDLDGSNDYIEINSIAPFMAGSTNFSVETWLNVDGTQTGNDIIFACNGASGNVNKIWLYLDDGILVVYDGSAGVVVGNSDLRDATWHHVTLTYDGAEVRVYVDGAYEGQVSGALSAFAANDRWSLGQEWDSGSSPTDLFNGTMDEVRIWNKTLCPAEINQRINCELAGNETNLIAYYQFNQGYLGMDNIGETVLEDVSANNADGNLINFALTGTSSNWVEGNTGVSGTCSSVGEPEVEVLGNAQIILDADVTPDVADDTDFGQVVVGSSQVHTFTVQNIGTGNLNIIGNVMITGADAADFTVTAQPASPITGSTTFEITFSPLGTAASIRKATVTIITDDCDEELFTFDIQGESIGTPATALILDGSNDYVNINSIAPTMATVTEFTIETWFNADNGQTGGNVILAANSSGGASNLFVLFLDGGTLRFNGGGGSSTYTSGVDYRDGQWHHIAVTHDGTEYKIYVDGLLVGTQNASPSFAANNRWSIGQEFDSGTSRSDEFKGKIDEVRIWSRALCATEIYNHTNCELTGTETALVAYYPFNQAYVEFDNAGETTALDASPNGFDGTLINFALSGAASNWVEGNTAITGTCVPVAEPELEILGNATVIMDGNTGIASANSTLFTTTAIVGSPLTSSQTYTISNTGTGSIYIDAINITGADAADFTTSFTAQTLAAGNSTTFTVIFDPSVGGQKLASIEILSTDCDETVYDFEIGGTALEVLSDVRGQMLVLDGTNDYVNINSISDVMAGATNFTFEAWVKADPSQAGQDRILSVNTSGGGNRMLFYLQDGVLRTYDGSTARSYGSTDLRSTPSNGWHHVAVTHDDSEFIVYLDGVEQGRFAGSVTAFSTNDLWSIGQEYDSGPFPGDYFRGAMDEVRVWRDVRTQQEIREAMHISLTGEEDNLGAYFQFDNDAGTEVKDVFGNNGTAINGATQAISEVAVGGGTSFTHTVNAAITYDFTGTDLELTFAGALPNDEVVVSKIITQAPYNESAGVLTNTYNEYWVVNNYGTNTGLDVTAKFKFDNGSITDTDPTNHMIHQRGSREYEVADWADIVANSVSTTAGDNHITINNLANFSQFVPSSSVSTFPIELIGFNAERLDRSRVELKWSTATELENEGFEVERMFDYQTEFETVDWVAGAGNSFSTIHYTDSDENTYEGLTYYRLKQVDFDGTATYTEIRAVEGLTLEMPMEMTVYPNPVRSNLYVELEDIQEEEEVTLRVMNLQGQIVLEKTIMVKAHEPIAIDVDDLPGGMYLLEIRLVYGQRSTQPFIKERL